MLPAPERLVAHLEQFPGAQSMMQWGENVVLKVAGKIFAIVSLELRDMGCVSIKADPAEFGELTSLRGVIPAPYLARAKWVMLQPDAELSAAEINRLLRRSYDLVVAGLSKAKREALAQTQPRRKK